VRRRSFLSALAVAPSVVLSGSPPYVASGASRWVLGLAPRSPTQEVVQPVVNVRALASAFHGN